MPRSKLWLAPLILLGLLILPVHTTAQDAIQLTISDPDIDEFPRIRVVVQARDASGQPIPGLPSSAFNLMEDGQPASGVVVEEIQVGTRLVFAVNTSPELRLRDSLGRSRFDLVRAALQGWLAMSEYAALGVDDFSLITTEGLLVDHSAAGVEIASTLGRFKPTFAADGGFEFLFRTLDLTGSPPERVGMPSYIFFITPLLRPSPDLPIERIISRASASQTTIIPILVGPPEVLEQAEIEVFRQLAQETGGQLIRFDPDVGLLGLATEMVARRVQYQLTYPSLATSSGPHELKVTLTLDEQVIESPARSYILELLEPSITLLNIPTEILRSLEDPSLPLEHTTPVSQPVEFAVAFPDGHPRPLVQSQLHVDGVIVDQKLEEPFSPLSWDLREVFEDRNFSIQVVTIDSLGMQADSTVTEIGMQVELPASGLSAMRPAFSSLLAALAVLLGGVALAALLISTGRRSSSLPVDRGPETAAPASPVSRLRQEVPDQPIEAYLHPLDGDPESPGTIYLTGMEINIGRDPNFAALPLTDPSVEGLHARIIRQADGSYFLRDQGSKAGTWVHYQQISSTGQKLSHGDIVHFGRSAHRFVLVHAPPEKKVRITPYNDPTQPTEDMPT